jgi:hypothetical protein
MDIRILEDEVVSNIKDIEYLYELSKLISDKNKLKIYQNLSKKNYIYAAEIPLLLNITSVLYQNFEPYSIDWSVGTFDIIFLNRNEKIINLFKSKLNTIDYIEYYNKFLESAVRTFYKINYNKLIDIPNLENFYIFREKLDIKDYEIIRNLTSYNYILNNTFLYNLAKNVNLVTFVRFFKLFDGKDIEFDKLLINAISNKYTDEIFDYIFSYLKSNNIENKYIDIVIEQILVNDIKISEVCFLKVFDKISIKRIQSYITKNLDYFGYLIDNISDCKILELLSYLSIENIKYISNKYLKNKSFKVDDVTNHFLKLNEDNRISSFLKIDYNDNKNDQNRIY